MTNPGLNFDQLLCFYAALPTIPGWSVMRTEAVMGLVFPRDPAVLARACAHFRSPR